MKRKDLPTTQRNRLLILVSLLAVAGLCRFSPAASRVCCGALDAIRGDGLALHGAPNHPL